MHALVLFTQHKAPVVKETVSDIKLINNGLKDSLSQDVFVLKSHQDYAEE